jgi:monofunctional biosynthetic peptidoglycan transglycosylase
VELDDGVFGAEAGARHRFGISAADLSVAQGVVLASMLPAPRRADLSRPSRWLRSRSRRLLDRMRDAGRISAEEHLRASSELERILAGPAPLEDPEEPPEEDARSASAPPHPDPLPREAGAGPAHLK